MAQLLANNQFEVFNRTLDRTIFPHCKLCNKCSLRIDQYLNSLWRSKGTHLARKAIQNSEPGRREMSEGKSNAK